MATYSISRNNTIHGWSISSPLKVERGKAACRRSGRISRLEPVNAVMRPKGEEKSHCGSCYSNDCQCESYRRDRAHARHLSESQGRGWKGHPVGRLRSLLSVRIKPFAIEPFGHFDRSACGPIAKDMLRSGRRLDRLPVLSTLSTCRRGRRGHHRSTSGWGVMRRAERNQPERRSARPTNHSVATPGRALAI